MPTNFNDIKLHIGDSIQLQDPNSKNPERIFVKLIGYRDGKSILVSMPRADGNEIQVQQGQIFIVRLFSVQTAYAFNVTVLDNKITPYPYMHISYPEELESVVVRTTQRVNVELIVSAQNNDPDKASAEPISAKLADISTGGAKLSTLEPIGELGDELSLSAKVTVGGLEQYLQILATIRRIDINDIGDKELHIYGLEFRFLEEKDRLVLHGFVYEQLSKN